MTDVVKIAKKCRAELAAEIARLDEFLSMADQLMARDQAKGGKAPGDELILSAKTPATATNGADAQS